MNRNVNYLRFGGGNSGLACFCFQKVDADSGAPLSGAVFQITNMCTGYYTRTVSDEAGRVCISLLRCQPFRLTEVAPPAGYQPSQTEYIIAADACGCVYVNGAPANSFTVPNQRDESMTYTVSYNSNGGMGGTAATKWPRGTPYSVRSNSQTIIFRPGHLFTGWNTEPNGSGTVYLPGDTIIISQNITLYAQWSPIFTYSVTYDSNGGSGGTTNAGLTAGTIYTVLSYTEARVSRFGHTFAGWNTRPDGSGTAYNPGETMVIAKNTVLYAQWS